MDTFSRLADQVYSVSEITAAIKEQLELSFPSLWVEGEISNFRVPSSGHFYFTLKDARSQIRGVMFRSRNAGLLFVPEDGLQVICRASLSVYPPRGDYQLIVEWMEPRGRGALQLAFEALKRRLASEGLFDEERKRPLPFLPAVVGLVTSPTGAAVRDVLKVLWRRHPNVAVRFCPVRVQGEGAAAEIAEAIRMLNRDGRADVIIVGRGGGSLEDLWAFNEEAVARAVADSRIPVVSAVGHEIDFTIADFVADLRAPTPSAAAELVVPEQAALRNVIGSLDERLWSLAVKDVAERRARLAALHGRLQHPGRRVQEGFLRLDELTERMRVAARRSLGQARGAVAGLRQGLIWAGPARQVEAGRSRLDALRRDLDRAARQRVARARQESREAVARLESMSPLAVLARGYSVTRRIPSQETLRTARGGGGGEAVEVILAEGRLECRVENVDVCAAGPGEEETS